MALFSGRRSCCRLDSRSRGAREAEKTLCFRSRCQLPIPACSAAPSILRGSREPPTSQRAWLLPVSGRKLACGWFPPWLLAREGRWWPPRGRPRVCAAVVDACVALGGGGVTASRPARLGGRRTPRSPVAGRLLAGWRLAGLGLHSPLLCRGQMRTVAG